MGHHHVVVGQTVDQQHRPLELSGVGDQRAALVRLGMLVGVTEETLGVVGVVEMPVGNRRADDGGMEDIGAPEDPERSEVSTERPSADGHASEIELWVALRRGVQRLDLILQRWRGQVESDGLLPPQPAARRPPAVGDQHREPLVRQPLRYEVRGT